MSDIHERIEREFNGRLRIRWSNKEHAWHVEQKFTRGFHPSRAKFRDQESDEMIRARDGYLQICAIQPGDRMECDKCFDQLQVPINEFRMIECQNCKRLGYQSKFVAGHYDLDSDHLLEHLRRLDPLKGQSNKLRERIAENNKAMWEREQRKPHDQAEAYVKDMSNDLFGIAHVGHTGKESAWVDAPETDYARNIQKTP